MGPYTGFIISAYAAAILIIVLLAGWIMLDHHQLTRLIDEAESRGWTRRAQRSRKERA